MGKAKVARKVWIPGSLPTGVALEDLAKATGDLNLVNLAADYHRQWLAGYLQRKIQRTKRDGSDITGFHVVRDGRFAGYDDTPVLRPASGPYFRIEQLVDTGRMDYNDRMLDVYAGLALPVRPHRTALQFSVPHYVDASIFTLSGKLSLHRLHHKLRGAMLAMNNLQRFRAAAVMEITGVIQEANRRGISEVDLLWSIEAPSVLYGLHLTPKPLRRPVRSWMIHHLAEMLGDIPIDRAVLHLCAARLNRQAIVRPTSLAIPVDFLTHLGGELDRRGLEWPAVTIPIALADRPAPQNAAFYAPLAALSERWRVILGVVDSRYREESCDGLRAAEAALGRTAWAISTTCGWADYSTQEMDDTVSLLHAMQDLPEAYRSI